MLAPPVVASVQNGSWADDGSNKHDAGKHSP